VRLAVLLCCPALAWAQGTTPKSKADDYEVHASTRTLEIGAEFMVHSVLAEEQSTVAKDYLVIEVALFPPRSLSLHVDHGDFAVRLNGNPLAQATAQMVGRPNPPYPSMPGQRRPLPRPPTPEQRAGIDPPERLTGAQLVERTALPEGDFKGPVSGYLYFPFKGKTASIHSLELIYDDTMLKLR
jgi:hypothetical protein